MKNLTEQQLLDNYQKLLDVVEEHFDGERKEKILKMLKEFQKKASVTIKIQSCSIEKLYKVKNIEKFLIKKLKLKKTKKY